MPAGDFFFNTAGGFLDGSIEVWTRNGGAAEVNKNFRVLFLGAGASALLDPDGVEDLTTIGAITGLAACEFDPPSGYTPKGEILIGRTLTTNTTRNQKKAGATNIAIANLPPGVLVPNITDFLLFWEPNSAVLANGIPIMRMKLAQSYTGQNAPFSVVWSPLGVFYTQQG
jgi:hypothetical protein